MQVDQRHSLATFTSNTCHPQAKARTDISLCHILGIVNPADAQTKALGTTLGYPHVLLSCGTNLFRIRKGIQVGRLLHLSFQKVDSPGTALSLANEAA